MGGCRRRLRGGAGILRGLGSWAGVWQGLGKVRRGLGEGWVPVEWMINAVSV